MFIYAELESVCRETVDSSCVHFLLDILCLFINGNVVNADAFDEVIFNNFVLVTFITLILANLLTVCHLQKWCFTSGSTFIIAMLV